MQVEISSQHFCGSHQRVAELERTLTHKQLEAIVRSGHLFSSPNGSTVAQLRTNNGGSMSLVVGGYRLRTTFWRTSIDADSWPRILGFHSDCVLVHGGLNDGRIGVFICSRDFVKQLSNGDELIGVQHSTSGPIVLVRDCTDPPDNRRLVLPTLQTDIVIHDRTFVTGISSGRLLVLDVIDGQMYRYIVGPDGFEEVYPVPIEHDAHIVGVVRWNGMCLIGIRTPEKSEIRAFGMRSWDLEKITIKIEGELEYLWQSPSQQTYAWLARVVKNGKVSRYLVAGQQEILSGPFMMSPNDLVWSPNGHAVGAHVRMNGFNGELHSLVSLNDAVNLPSSESKISEFCVDDNGRIATWIVSDGNFHRPFVRKRPHDAVVFAWNLRLMADGTVGYNYVHGNLVNRIIDRTDAGSNVMS
ncbi:hypothetical protein HY771_02355 [Candidatus Uhrbacteria bacterium]|nr:hypothetical protein [Candidatus Uhrbacteria bacterium]